MCTAVLTDGNVSCTVASDTIISTYVRFLNEYGHTLVKFSVILLNCDIELLTKTYTMLYHC